MAFHRLGLHFRFLFKSAAPSFGRRALINPCFPVNGRQFTSRPGFQSFWRRARSHHVFRLANNVIPARSVRNLRRGLVPGSLAYSVGKNGEVNVERTVVGAPVSSAVAGKSVSQTLRTTRARRISTKGNQRGQKEIGQESTKTKTNNSLKEPHPEEESQSYFHRPTKEQLLSTATSFFHRLHIRFKWPLVRSLRPFNMDDISAFVSACGEDDEPGLLHQPHS